MTEIQIENFWKILPKIGKIFIKIFVSRSRSEVNFGPGSKFEGPRSILAILGHFGILGSWSLSDPDRSGLREISLKKPVMAEGAWVPGPMRVWWPLGPKLTKLVKILTFWQNFVKFWENFHEFLTWILMIFEILSWDLDRSWMTSGCLSSSISVFLDCVARGWRMEIWIFGHFWPFWLLGFWNFWNLAEIFHRNFWLWGVISWRVG